MEHGTSHGDDDGLDGVPAVPEQPAGAPGRMPLAVVVVDAEGLVTHWSSGARRLFGRTREQAVGLPAVELMPVSGALRGADVRGEHRALDDSLDRSAYYPTAGRARMTDPARRQVDVLWWAYPLVGPGPERLLVLAADARGLGGDAAGERERFAPGFALHTEFPGAERLAGRLPDILPNMGPATGSRIVAQVLELGYPVLEISRQERVPVTPDWGIPRYRERQAWQARYEAARRRAETTDGALPHPRTPEESAGPARPGGLDPALGPDPGVELGPDPGIDPDPALDLDIDPALGLGLGLDLDPDLEHTAVRERLEFLNEVSGRIGSSLDLARTIREVTSAAVPRFADFAGTHLRAQVLAGEGFPDGPPDVTTVWHRVWVEHNDEPGRWDDTVPVGESIAFPEHTPFFQCMVTGEPVLIPYISDEVGDRIAGQFEKRDLRPLINGRSVLIVPLKARDVVLGFMVLLRRPGREPFDDMDRTTGAELAARAGLVLDNARMYTYQENVAETLQESMLPQVTPRMAGCDTATRYLPGTRLGRVGGDWFDSVKLPGSRTALVVGDVMGHGLNSAAMMGQLRTAVQTMAALDLPPAQLLRNLDDLAQRLGEHYLATCLYAVYDPIRSELLLSNAGHVPPVLVRAGDGRSELLDLPTGAPIGVGGVPFETAKVRVAPGDRLVLCTDGLVEVRGQDIGAGLAALCESAAHPAASMDDACDTIIRALAASSRDTDGRGGRKDDVALLMARLNGIPAGHVAQWRLALDPREVRRARRLVRERLVRWGLAEAVETAELLVSEAVTNAIRHAHTHHVMLRLVRTEALLCEVSDDDHELPALLSADGDDEYGRGLRVISGLAREWGTSRTGRGKTVWFEQALPRPAASGSNTE